MPIRILGVAAVSALIGGAALAQDELAQVCFEQLRMIGGPDGECGTVLDTDWSQAGTMIHCATRAERSGNASPMTMELLETCVLFQRQTMAAAQCHAVATRPTTSRRLSPRL